MDISKASNFERFVFDLAGRDPAVVAALWREVEHAADSILAGPRSGCDCATPGFVSGRSTHADRIATITHACRAP